MLTLDGKLYQAPLGKDRPVKRCLDAGTGTGVWAMDFGELLCIRGNIVFGTGAEMI